MRSIAFSLFCLIAITAFSASPPLYGGFAATHYPGDPVAIGINCESVWRKTDREDPERQADGNCGDPYGSSPVPSIVCQKNQFNAHKSDPETNRIREYGRLARAPPGT